MVLLEPSESHGTCLRGAEVVKGTATARSMVQTQSWEEEKKYPEWCFLLPL